MKVPFIPGRKDRINVLPESERKRLFPNNPPPTLKQLKALKKKKDHDKNR